MASNDRLEREVRNRFKVAKAKTAANYSRLTALLQLSDQDRMSAVEIGLKFMELDEKEQKSALLIGRAQNRAVSPDELAAVTGQVIAALEGMIEEFDKLNARLEEILARYETS